MPDWLKIIIQIALVGMGGWNQIRGIFRSEPNYAQAAYGAALLILANQTS